MPDTDPAAWSRLCDDARGQGFVFRRGIELALEWSRGLVEPGQRWIDVGCGTGRLLRGLREAGTSAAGVDVDPRMLERARRAIPAAPLTVARAEQLPFGPAAIDGVVATSLMGCLDEAEPVWAEIRRVLKPQGHAVVTFTNRDSWLVSLNYALRPRRKDAYRLHRASQVLEALRELGFEVVRVRFYSFVLTAWSRMFPPAALARRLECTGSGWLATRLARNFIVVVRKVTP